MRYRLRCVAALLALTVGTVACSSGTGPVAKHDYPSQVVPGDFDDAPSLGRGMLVESLRLGEHLPFADGIDPDLTEGRGGGVIADHTGITDLLSGVQRTALMDFDVYAGFGAIAGNTERHNEQANKWLSIAILAFADEETARRAATAMEEQDFTANTENARIAVPGFPAALTHWRPGIPTVGSWLVWRNHVIRVYAKVIDPVESALADVVARTYAAHLAELADFTPTPVTDLPALRLDPDGMLTHLVKTADYVPDHRRFAVYGPRAMALLNDRPSENLREYTDHGVRAIAVSHNKFLYRATDAASAAAYAEAGRARMTTANYAEMAGPPGTRCVRALRPAVRTIEARRFGCQIVHGEFVAQVFGIDETDTRALARAQRSVLSEW
ncbi:hypothetical protein IU433_27200 [Nocardia puris]|uniref:Lipoprotein n=1 Tax=Nocardia puris TaxID=208602 RepID=A0A366DK69_9NOCA|nr:hypothetical protein [Nocardia puris]MBF6213081.1 hypothetical protein [Nocardia puris]MBF6368071.1 hypothetical protein [Nocardia puris]MBF6462705.1 hypothetical protein [Nocardia puris]RBO90325.1 hypothetical protein DFR74_106210 [Nocardia puris]